MKLIIDIPDYKLDEVQNGSIASNEILKAVRNGTPVSSEGDLISRSELKEAIESLVVGGVEGLKDYYENGSKSDENAWIGGVYDAYELCVNAPPVEPTIKPICEVKFDKEQLQEIVDKAKAEVLASIQRPQGEWILTDGKSFECPFCLRLFDFNDNYCGFCGAKMQKGGAE